VSYTCVKAFQFLGSALTLYFRAVWRITGKIFRTTILLINVHAHNGVITVLGLACFFLYFVFCVSVKVKLTVPLLCVCVHSTWKGHLRNDLYCVGWDVKPYSLTHSLTHCTSVAGYSQPFIN